ncbi:MAG: hypothetical protein K0R93_1434 [Anaerosolibacter sp.]|jgi:hypothetical protein|uniref:putative nucleotide-diphospho-sugar transferase n=1 Tax=Anaerosolibacter sp. TaxID=1872527 RepID=UPI00260EB3AA|nr:putative nucleotide-diphospho-sugar transferase [Anaerosolibacter sp.]MDF2546536.1 hypothetical protein [Anaerosolibacter sp.]
MINGYCIILSKFRLYQVVALYHSLASNISDLKSFKVFILCMDHETYDILSKLNLENVLLIQLQRIETDELRSIKKGRKLNEYCWTLKPVFLEYVLKKYLEIDRVTHLDADLYFYGDPTSIFINQPDISILLSDHDYSDKHKYIEDAAGKTNSGIVSFKRDKHGFKCLKWWKERCYEWCFDRVEGDKFGDQRYLNKAPQLFKGVSYINTPGVNIAPWNEEKYKFTLKDSRVLLNKDKLIMYHFCGFRLLNKNEYTLELDWHKNPIPVIYEPYVNAILNAITCIEKADANFNGFYKKSALGTGGKVFRLAD